MQNASINSQPWFTVNGGSQVRVLSNNISQAKIWSERYFSSGDSNVHLLEFRESSQIDPAKKRYLIRELNGHPGFICVAVSAPEDTALRWFTLAASFWCDATRKLGKLGRHFIETLHTSRR